MLLNQLRIDFNSSC